MSRCSVCETELPDDQKTCHVCGSSVTEAGTGSVASASAAVIAPVVAPAVTSAADSSSMDVSFAGTAVNKDTATNGKKCPDCGRTFDATYTDDFCPCGAELVAGDFSVAAAPTSKSPSAGTPSITPTAPPPIPVHATTVSGTGKPPVGTACLVLYSDTKPRTPVKYFPVEKDVLLIGRQDAVRGDFPDVDLSQLLDEAAAKKVSRRHALLLRSRQTQSYALRPLGGNTGTQIGKDLATPDQDHPLADGTPIILGGAAWLKFEVIK